MEFLANLDARLQGELSTLLWWATGLSLVAVVATVIGIPWVVSRLPHDYFTRSSREAWRHIGREPLLALILGVLKNILGAVLVLLGVIMLFTPGQGLLTILIGLMLMNFPGKYELERWMVRRPGVLRALNWLRRRSGKLPFKRPPKEPRRPV